MDRIIKLPDDWEKRIGEMLDFQIVDFLYGIIRNGTPIPDNATNGDMIKALFPTADISLNDSCFEGVVNKYGFDMKWWNSPYQKGGKR